MGTVYSTVVDYLDLYPPLNFDAPEEVPRSYEHQILGNSSLIPDHEFQPKIRQCLDLLKTVPVAYNFFVSYQLPIRAAERSGANFGDHAIDIARATFDASLTWLTSVILHETIHFWVCSLFP